MLDKLFAGRFVAQDVLAQGKLWAELNALGLIEGKLSTNGGSTQSDLPSLTPNSPWYIQLMQSLAAWVASLFILAFTISFFSLFFDDLDTTFATIIGLFYSGLAILVYRLSPSQLFLNQMALALSLCGLLSLGYGITGWFSDDFGLGWFLAFGSILMLNWLLVEHYSHQCVMSFGVLACVIGIGYELQLLELMPVIINLMFVGLWLTHANTGQHFARMSAMGYMLALWMVLIQLPLMIGHTSIALENAFPVLANWANALSVSTTLIITMALLINIFGSLSLSLNSKQGLISMLVMVLLAALSIPMVGLLSAVLILIVGFYVGERLIFSLGLLGIVSFVAWYYYSMQVTLLEKSIWLLALGVILLVAKLLLGKILPNTESGSNA
ncbi:DUF4401 domain-containing protein [Shewanella sp. 30m-9]